MNDLKIISEIYRDNGFSVLSFKNNIIRSTSDGLLYYLRASDISETLYFFRKEDVDMWLAVARVSGVDALVVAVTEQAAWYNVFPAIRSWHFSVSTRTRIVSEFVSGDNCSYYISKVRLGRYVVL